VGLSISWVAVVVAIVVGMAIAWVWYSDWGLVGGVWRKLTGVTKEDSARGGKGPFAILVVSIIVTALALAAAWSVASVFFDSRSAWLALAVGFTAWLGFSLSTLAQHNGFEQKPARLTVINSAYQFVLFLGMGLVIGLLQ
jgi:flagellar basal body-associated protein FliL